MLRRATNEASLNIINSLPFLFINKENSMDLRETVVIENIANLLQVKIFDYNAIASKLEYAKKFNEQNTSKTFKLLSEKLVEKKTIINTCIEAFTYCGYDVEIGNKNGILFLVDVKVSSSHDILINYVCLQDMVDNL